MQSLKGLVALVTGGASGYGLSTTHQFVKQGMRVLLCDLPTSKGSEVAQQLGENVVFIPTDVTSQQDVKKAIDECADKFKKLNVLVNCAGTNVLSKTFDFGLKTPHSLESFSKIIQVNTCGTFNTIRLAVGLMAKNAPGDDGEKGVIVNLTSTQAFEGSVGHVAFAAASGCIAAMTLPLARDLSSEGIRCCAIATGLFDTPYFRSLPEKYRKFMPSIVPFPKGLGSPHEFAHLVQAIVENKMLNGEVIRLDAALRLDI